MDRTALIAFVREQKKLDFESAALAVFQYQYRQNAIYRKWCNDIGCDNTTVQTIHSIPFLPISAFKKHKIQSTPGQEVGVFESSGTTGSVPSKHYVWDRELYLQTTQEIFESFYGEVSSYCILALLPAYLERRGSSLIAMVDYFVEQSVFSESGFYLYDHEALFNQLLKCKSSGIPTLLFGVSFALLDFIEKRQLNFPELTIIETGGMKGRRKEITRDDLHDRIAQGFGVQHVHSEYGMTELFSQAYAQKNGMFQPGATLRVLMGDMTDPFSFVQSGATGIIKAIDLANIDSCAFIETQDIGKLHDNGSFEVLGRLDASDIRGCNLMVGDL